MVIKSQQELLKYISKMNIRWYQVISIFYGPRALSKELIQAMSYVIDVYREKIKPDTNPLKFMLFMSYFPQIVLKIVFFRLFHYYHKIFPTKKPPKSFHQVFPLKLQLLSLTYHHHLFLFLFYYS